jgi:S1-C subfamily serine protease
MTRRSALAVAVLAGLCFATAAPAADDPKKDDKPTGYIGVKMMHEEGGPITVQETVPDSPAEKAGLKAGDVIKKLGGKAVTDLPEFVKKVRGSKPGDKLVLTVERDGKEKEVTITVGKPPE